MTHNWQNYAALRSAETVFIAGRILDLLSQRRLEKTEAQALLVEIEGGASGLDQLAVCMRAQNADVSCAMQIESLSVAWLQMSDLVQRYADLTAASIKPPHLRLVSSRPDRG